MTVTRTDCVQCSITHLLTFSRVIMWCVPPRAGHYHNRCLIIGIRHSILHYESRTLWILTSFNISVFTRSKKEFENRAPFLTLWFQNRDATKSINWSVNFVRILRVFLKNWLFTKYTFINVSWWWSENRYRFLVNCKLCGAVLSGTRLREKILLQFSLRHLRIETLTFV